MLQVTHGFSYWKDATVCFKKHKKSVSYLEAIEVMVTLPATMKDIGEQLSHLHASQKINNRKALLQIILSIRYLSRQGLALRGDGDE